MGLENSKQAFVCNLQELLQARGVGIEKQLLEYFPEYIDSFPYIKPSLHPWDVAFLVLMDDRFDVFLDLVFENFVEYFCIRKIGLKFSFFVGSLCGLGVRVIVGS